MSREIKCEKCGGEKFEDYQPGYTAAWVGTGGAAAAFTWLSFASLGLVGGFLAAPLFAAYGAKNGFQAARMVPKHKCKSCGALFYHPDY